MIGLAYWDNGFKVMSANKPLRGCDFKGLKFASNPQGAGAADARARCYSAGHGVLDVYQALQTGVVDGQENTRSEM
jgi:C4-dicarboxylate-binding protein DctP